jgi:hypothetical protein
MAIYEVKRPDGSSIPYNAKSLEEATRWAREDWESRYGPGSWENPPELGVAPTYAGGATEPSDSLPTKTSIAAGLLEAAAIGSVVAGIALGYDLAHEPDGQGGWLPFDWGTFLGVAFGGLIVAALYLGAACVLNYLRRISARLDALATPPNQ